MAAERIARSHASQRTRIRARRSRLLHNMLYIISWYAMHACTHAQPECVTFAQRAYQDAMKWRKFTRQRHTATPPPPTTAIIRRPPNRNTACTSVVCVRDMYYLKLLAASSLSETLARAHVCARIYMRSMYVYTPRTHHRIDVFILIEIYHSSILLWHMRANFGPCSAHERISRARPLCNFSSNKFLKCITHTVLVTGCARILSLCRLV